MYAWRQGDNAEIVHYADSARRVFRCDANCCAHLFIRDRSVQIDDTVANDDVDRGAMRPGLAFHFVHNALAD